MNLTATQKKAGGLQALFVVLVIAILEVSVGVVFAAEASPSPLVSHGNAVDWWFVFKFNAKSFPGCTAKVSAGSGCAFGGEESKATQGRRFAFASSAAPQLVQSDDCIGTSDTDPVGATFGALFTGKYFYVVWNDQFYGDPTIPGCGESCAAPWGHSKGVLAWGPSGEGFIMQVTTPSWPGAASSHAQRSSSGNTLGCILRPNNVLVSQSFFALRLNSDDVVQVLHALANASVVTDAKNPQLVNPGGPQEIQDAVRALGVKQKGKAVFKVQLSTGAGLLSKPSALHVPPWQLVSSQLDQAPLRVASWWTVPAIDSTTASTSIDCWDASLPKPGAVEIATSGHWKGTRFGLKGGPGPDFNHAKVGVSTGGDHHFVIFGDMNQQGVLSDENCGRSQNGRGGMFFILDNKDLWTSVTQLLDGDTAPVAGQ